MICEGREEERRREVGGGEERALLFGRLWKFILRGWAAVARRHSPPGPVHETWGRALFFKAPSTVLSGEVAAARIYEVA